MTELITLSILFNSPQGTGDTHISARYSAPLETEKEAEILRDMAAIRFAAVYGVDSKGYAMVMDEIGKAIADFNPERRVNTVATGVNRDRDKMRPRVIVQAQTIRSE